MTDEGGSTGAGRREPGWKRILTSTLDAWRARSAARGLRVRPPPETKFTRSATGAAIDARRAVRAGVRLEDFLRHRLARYATRLPVPLEALPVRIDVENGEPVVLARPSRAQAATHGAAPRPAAERWIRALEAREGPAAVRAVRELEAALEGLDRRAAVAQERIAVVDRGISDDLASGALAAAPAVDATAEQLGRPPVPTAAPVHVLRGFALALLGAEAWRLADPILALSGLRTADLGQAAEHAPAAAALGLVFALGAAAAVFTFLGAAVSRLHALADDPAAPRRRALLLAVASGASGLAAAIAISGGAPSRAGAQVLLLVVPLAAVLMVRHAARLEADRAVALAAALLWDRARAAEAVARAQRAEALARAQGELARIEADRTVVRRRLRALEERAVAAVHAAEEEAQLETRRLDRLAEALAAALELDRYAFLKLASANAHEMLSRPVRAERPARLEPAVAPERLGVA
ncbi:hypothetical protein [Anaeromyxobacter oryzae]|uniref:Uncharacterized protein n=1 Tax=Anaeromyxobacter oryzae TaxID=2918170 RepID=A0ABN6MWU8_9BACT|nr:hypothetical protein [Anaeromyxobacter oryzae]BDG05376.1 hypothetical protein AMOR_43720 [Anaeromyxobacter oryzae]